VHVLVLTSEWYWSNFKYFIILILSAYYMLCIGWIMNCLTETRSLNNNVVSTCIIAGLAPVKFCQHTLTFQSLAVSLRTARFNVQKFYMVLALRWVFCKHISEQAATLALYIINWLVFITFLESVYSAVWTHSLYKADYVWSLNNCGGKCLQRGMNWFLI